VTCDHNPNWIPQGQVTNGAGLGSNVVCFDLPRGSSPIQCACTPSGPVVCQVQVKPSGGSCSDLNDNSTSVRFADLNGDGRAEYLWLDAHGALGANSGPNAAKVGWFPQGVIASGVGATRAQVHLADLNGDGRAEYLWVHDDGSVDAWLNRGGPDDGPNAAKVGWIPQGTIAGGIGKGKLFHISLIYGKGKFGYMCLSNIPNLVLNQACGQRTGAVQAWLNGGGPDDGPNAAKVVWLPQGTIASDVGSIGWGIQLADLNGDGRAEYIDIDYTTSNGC
ncbi:hypothetical protein B0H14DRAFT_2405693, partial [Mycena olivaceomarginata]